MKTMKRSWTFVLSSMLYGGGWLCIACWNVMLLAFEFVLLGSFQVQLD